LGTPPRRAMFFSKARGSIRAPLVTGVHTCALPISPREPARLAEELSAHALVIDGLGDELFGQAGRLTGSDEPSRDIAAVDVEDRSEERRGGEGGDGRRAERTDVGSTEAARRSGSGW